MYNLNVFIFFFSLSTISLGNIVINKTKPYCEFNEEIFSHSYNLTKLSKPGEDIVIHHNSNETIRMQLCLPLIKKCNGKDGYSICLEKNDKEIGIGKVIPKLSTKSGKIHFTFIGDECKPDVNYTVDILIMCDYLINSHSTPITFEQKSKCQFHMVWSSAFACAKRKEINCTVTDPSDGSHYDLSPLKRYSDNYDIYVGNNTSVNLILNVCHSVIFGYNVLCPISSGACLQDPKKEPKLRYLNLGNVQKPLTIDSSKNLILEYEDGSMCKNGQQIEHHIRTTITFICNLDAKDTSPEVIKTDGCHYQLKWITVAACSLKLLREYSAKTVGKCTINNPITNFMYDLQSLMNKDFNVTSSQGKKYIFRVCGPVATNKCKEKTGVCLKENGTSLGMANTNLMWQQGGPYLNYTDGDKCSDSQYHQTLIAFLCGPEGSTNDPIIIKESPCQLIIHWNLNLVCENKIKCATVDNEINLTPLIRSTSNYIVNINSTVFYINVCQPIVKNTGLECEHGSAICKASLNANNELVKENLGFPKNAPEMNKDQIILRYLDGSACQERTDTKISSVLLFVCGNKNEGAPEFKNYSNCTYTFEWKTSIACGAVMGDWIPPCMIKDRIFLNQFDLSLLYTKQPMHYVKGKEKNYGINICGKQKNCNGSTVCQESNNYGSLSNVIFDYNRNYTKLEYLNGSKCSNSSYMSEIKFICNESSEIGEPKLSWESQCRAEFEWYTNLTCIHRANMESKFSLADKQQNIQSSSSHAGLIAGIVITVCMFLLALLYYRNPNKRACLHSCFHYCNSRRGNGRVQYCRVGTTEQAHLLLDPNNDPTQCQSDSDDDILDA
ncbi:cation-independent mannose-6-phosphate receptor isoform X1 [Polistes fuscatus]|uniref:cation-independent mannose-6-phosphate receptor isoform X1 n=2 Tax=Polistes fuscatus TaxID=30207 RepID=UPI001CA93810|nr:cation-independent mannose-6-phosphate receptor isoform X1 [Polistes fuscatus]